MLRTLSCVFLCAACTHHQRLTNVNEVTNEWVTVETTRGEVEAYAIAHPFGVAFQRANGQILERDSVVRVTQKRGAHGAVEGLGFGFVIGAAGGAVLGYVAAEEDGGAFCILLCSKNEGAALGGLFLGLVGAVVGGVIGGVRGSRVVYEGKVTSSVTLVGPAGSAAGMTVAF